MRKRLADTVRRLVGPSLALVGLVGIPSISMGQLYTTDPYDPAGRPFRGYVYPRGGDEFAAGYAPRARGYVAPNQLDRYTDDLDMPLGSRGSRYDSAFRRFDEDFGRVYQPTDKDKKYVEERERRERNLIGAMTERDPKKRASLLREAEQESKKASSDPLLSIRRGASGTGVANAPTRRAPRSKPSTTKPSVGGAAPTRIPPASSTTRPRPAAGGSSPSPDTAPNRIQPKPAAGTGAAPSSGRTSSALRSIDRSSALPTDVLRRSREREAASRPPVDSLPPTRPQ